MPSTLLFPQQSTFKNLPIAQNASPSIDKDAPLKQKTVTKTLNPPPEDMNAKSEKIVLLVFAANRPLAIKNHLTQLLR